MEAIRSICRLSEPSDETFLDIYYSIEHLLGICIDSFSLENFHCVTYRPSIG